MLAAIYHSRLVRLIPIGLVLLGIQMTVFVQIKPFGVIIELVMAFAVAAGAASGPDNGAIAGFVLGLMLDLAIGSPLGLSAITLGAGAAFAGWVDLLRVETTWWLAALFVTVGAAIAELGIPTMRYIVGERGAFVPETWKIVPVVAIAAGLLSPLFVPIGRWAMRVEPDEWKPNKVKTVDDG